MDTFIDSYTNCFRKYATFSGRSARKEYIIFTVTNYVLSLVLGSIPLLGGIFFLAVLIPGLTVSVRRLHDLNRSGWWITFPYILAISGFITYISTENNNTSAAFTLLLLGGISLLVMSIWMLFFKGTTGPNRFGDEQKNNNETANFNASAAADNITARLEQAKKMLDDGLINETEYEAMRKKIIDNF